MLPRFAQIYRHFKSILNDGVARSKGLRVGVKMKRLGLLFVLILSLFVAPLQAQRLGEGRLLRRILGFEPPPAVEAEEKQRPEASRNESASGKDGRPAKTATPPTALPKSPSQSPRRPANRHPSPPATRTDAGIQRLPGPSAGGASAGSIVAPRHPQQFQQPKPVRTFKHDGFGITLRTHGKKVIVSKIDKDGTAARAGIQQGDIVKSIASLPMSNPADVKQFSEVLKAGDQVEFEIVRRGKEEKVLVSFLRNMQPDLEPHGVERQVAEAPLLPSPAEAPARSPSRNRTSSRQRSEVEELRELVRMQRQVIAELQARVRRLEQSTDTTGPTLALPR